MFKKITLPVFALLYSANATNSTANTTHNLTRSDPEIAKIKSDVEKIA